ncbi:hypothetical protein GCM10010266_49560 [Streptomyces griseomycini]|uniref:Uncharacterized protein n=1 Tax=Streptomyces griseomycini TaxID=66895 RepID=A0A7W7LWZ5_9ACTN|nr:hypothetical protein [Streptomyces griseomycini]GGQ20469.1 hypothetical protein GCM10010266_49560 [Streptomyces griseomycini]GGR11630.1 hypothetical protein GCM10015536_16430 [Streptomyces griseomycini]
MTPGGCLVGLGCAGLMVLAATLDWLWGDDAWQWAAASWPGGAYAFAVCIGVIGPCLAALSVFSLSHMGWKSWRKHPARTLTHTAVGVASTVALMPLGSLITNAQNSGGWARSRTSSPTWVFSHYPWLWAVGLASTVVSAILLIRVVVAYHRLRRRSPAPGAESGSRQDAVPPESP